MCVSYHVGDLRYRTKIRTVKRIEIDVSIKSSWENTYMLLGVARRFAFTFKRQRTILR